MKHKEEKRKQAGLFLPNRELSWVVALALMLCFLMFSLGYFWGQYKIGSRLLSKVEEESFADRITYALYANSGQEPTEDEENDEQEEAVEEATVKVADSAPVEKEQIKKELSKTVEQPEIVYVAPLVGFGTLQAAQSFAKRVKNTGIDVIIKERKSTTARGKKISWYQAVTEEYDTKKDLEDIIDILQKRERLKDVNIIEKRKVSRSC